MAAAKKKGRKKATKKAAKKAGLYCKTTTVCGKTRKLCYAPGSGRRGIVKNLPPGASTGSTAKKSTAKKSTAKKARKTSAAGAAATYRKVGKNCAFKNGKMRKGCRPTKGGFLCRKSVAC